MDSVLNVWIPLLWKKYRLKASDETWDERIARIDNITKDQSQVSEFQRKKHSLQKVKQKDAVVIPKQCSFYRSVHVHEPLSIFTKVLINVRRLAQKALMIELFKALELFPNTLQIFTIDPITGQRHRGMFESAKMNEKKTLIFVSG